MLRRTVWRHNFTNLYIYSDRFFLLCQALIAIGITLFCYHIAIERKEYWAIVLMFGLLVTDKKRLGMLQSRGILQARKPVPVSRPSKSPYFIGRNGPPPYNLWKVVGCLGRPFKGTRQKGYFLVAFKARLQEGQKTERRSKAYRQAIEILQ